MKKGRFAEYGGQYIPETLMSAVQEVEEAYEYYKNDPAFQAELTDLLENYAGRPSLLYYVEKMTRDLGGAKIYLKREDLNHTGSHKINNVLGQVLLAKKMGKTRVIAETGAGQHGVGGLRRLDGRGVVAIGEANHRADGHPPGGVLRGPLYIGGRDAHAGAAVVDALLHHLADVLPGGLRL